MNRLVVGMLGQPFFKMILKEWSLHVKTNQDPTTFANMYMEWMRDPLDHEARMAVSLFASFMKPREWPDLLRVMEPHLELDVLAVFRSEGAKGFYDGFRNGVFEQILAYWSEFMEARKKATGEEIGPRDWSPRSHFCVCKKHPSKCLCKPFP